VGVSGGGTRKRKVTEDIVAARNDRKATSDSSLNTEKVNFLSNASTPSARSPTNSAVDKDEKEKPAPNANTKKVRAKTTSRLAQFVAESLAPNKKNGVKKKINKKRNATARPGNANHGCGEARNEILGHLCSSFSSRVGVDDERLLYANPFPMTATIESIMDFFGKECDGGVLSVRLRRDRVSKVFNGSIFVEFATEESAKKVNEKSNALVFEGAEVTTMFKKEYLEKKKEEKALKAEQKAKEKMKKEEKERKAKELEEQAKLEAKKKSQMEEKKIKARMRAKMQKRAEVRRARYEQEEKDSEHENSFVNITRGVKLNWSELYPNEDLYEPMRRKYHPDVYLPKPEDVTPYGLTNNEKIYCFMNAVLQVLANCPAIYDFMVENTLNSRDIRFRDYMQMSRLEKAAAKACGVEPLQFNALLALKGALNDMWHKRDWTERSEFLHNMHLFQPGLEIGEQLREQQDSHEFFRGLLNACTASILDARGAPEECREQTFFWNIFGGKLYSRVSCANCKRPSPKIEPFQDLSLGIQKGVCTLQAALEAFTSVEELEDYKCEACKASEGATKRFSILELPKVLALQLKRFDNSFRKIEEHVRFETKLDLSPILTSKLEGNIEEIVQTLSVPLPSSSAATSQLSSPTPSAIPAMYNLFAVLVHIGDSLGSGHYVTYVKQREGYWYKTDDEIVTHVNEEEVRRQKAYMLFYTLCNAAAADDDDEDDDDKEPPSATFLTTKMPPSIASRRLVVNEANAKKFEKIQMKNSVATVSTQNADTVAREKQAEDDTNLEEMCEEYSQLLDEYESDSSDSDDDDIADVDDEFGGNKEELLYDSDDDNSFGINKSRKKTSSRLSRENNKKEKISLREYFEKMEVPPEALRGLGENATNLSEAIPELCEKNSELIVDLIKKDLANEKRAERIDFSTLEEVEFKWRLHVGETFTRGFGYTSGKERQALVDRIDSEFARSFDFLIRTIKEDCQKNVQEALETPASVNLDQKNFVRGKENITKVLEKLQVLFEPTFRDVKVGQITKAFRANYGQSGKKKKNNIDDPVPSNDSPAPSQSIVFGVSSSNAGEVFEREKLYGDEKTFSIDTGIDNVHSLRDLLKQLPAAFDKAKEKEIEIVISMNLGVSTYAVATIGEEENNAQIKELERDLIEYTKKAGTKIPVPSFASYMKERLQISLCYQNPVANIDKCLEGNPMQHTIKKMDEVAQETSKAALTPAERKKLVIIELQIDLTALRAPGRKYYEHMIQKYAKREMKLNMKLVLDFAFEFGFRITVNSRWFFKRLVKYLQTSSTTIGKEYYTQVSAEEDLLSPEVASSLSDENLMKTSSSTEDVCEERAARVLNASLAAASEKIFHISVMPSLSGKNAASTNHPQQVLHVYCNLHLSQALRHGGNVNMFAIVVLKIMAAYGLSLRDAIQRARSTYYFNNLIARSVVVDFLQERKENIDGLKNFGKLSYFDVHSFLNPDALKKLICILYSKLPGGEIVDPTNDRAQLRAWRTCINLASKTNASELGLWPETIKCSLLRLMGIFTSATFECFGSNGKGWQYDFREFGSIAQLSWYINLTMGIRNTRNKKRALEAAKAWNEIATNDFDTSADEEAKKERLSVKLKLAKFATAKKYEKRKGKKEKTSDDDSRVLNIVFPPRQVDLANRMINGKEVIKRKDPFWQDIWDNDWIVLPGTTNGHCLVCKREGVLDADCVFGKNNFADHYRRKHLKLESKPPRSQMYTKSKYRGVHQGAYGGKWRARIGSLSLGSFDTEVEAARAYDTAVLARDADKPSNLRAKTNFGDEDHNIFPDHEKQRTNECGVCQKRFTTTGSLQSHMRTHTGEKPYECDVCEKRFFQSSHLKTHMRTHTGEKPYECDVCEKRFITSSDLKKHMRTHTGEKPYECDVCEKRFKTTGYLKTHMRIHTGEKPYECDVCEKRFFQSSSLQNHMRTHTGEKPYECDVCEKCFRNSSNLQIHMRTHTGEKPYECDVCQKRFIQSNNLKKHMRTHTGEKPYECDVCENSSES